MKYNMLVENVSRDDILSQPYFKKFKDLKLCRGIEADLETQYMPFKFREKPLDTDISIHHRINDVSVEKFNIPIRNLLFAVPSRTVASSYGNVYIIVPNGEFTLYSNPKVSDMTEHYGLRRATTKYAQEAKEDAMHKLLYIDNGDIRNMATRILDTVFGTNILNGDLKEFIAEKTKLYLEKVYFKEQEWDEKFSIEALSVMDGLAQIMIDVVEKRVTDVVDGYLDGVIEIKSPSDIKGGVTPEIMVYCPEGFYLIPVDEYEELIT